MNIKKELAIVTGGSSGIGFGISRHLAQNFDVAIVYKSNQEKAEKSRIKLQAEFPNRNIQVFQCDVRSYDEVIGAYKTIKKQMGSPSVLINNAGIMSRSNHFMLEDVAMYKEIIDVNYLGTVYFCKAVVPDMIRSGYGRIINMSSTSAGNYVEGHSAYSTSKAAVEKFSGIVSGELLRYGITINVIRPGLVLTPGTTAFYEDLKKNPSRFERIMGPVPKLIEVNQICNAIDFILKSDQVAAAIIDIDYGQNKIDRI